MKEAFILRRPGIIVVSGIVTNICDNFITIRNTHQFPISGCEDVYIDLKVTSDIIAHMKVKNGASLIASTSDHFLVEMLEEGGETLDRSFELNAFTLRYNGSFDFDPYGERGEEHVLCGTLTAAKKRGTDKNGMPVWQALVMWKRNSVEETRTVLYYGLEDLSSKVNARVIFVTGAKKEYEEKSYFESEIIYDF